MPSIFPNSNNNFIVTTNIDGKPMNSTSANVVEKDLNSESMVHITSISDEASNAPTPRYKNIL